MARDRKGSMWLVRQGPRESSHPRHFLPQGQAFSAKRSANCFSLQLRTRVDAEIHVGLWSANEGNGAAASIVAISR